MNRTRTDAGTHVEEWADLVGDEVPEQALRERPLGGRRRLEEEGDRDRWPGGAS